MDYYKLLYIVGFFMRVSPDHGYFDTVFYIDASQSSIDLVYIEVTVSSGEVQVAQVNHYNRVVSIRLLDSVKGTKTVTLSDGTITETVDIILELPHNPETREGHTIQDAKRPKWPYRTY